MNAYEIGFWLRDLLEADVENNLTSAPQAQEPAQAQEEPA